MSDDYFALRADSPVRPPDWRVRLAALLHSWRRDRVSTSPDEVPDQLVRHLLTAGYRWRWDAPPAAEREAIRAAVHWHRTAPAAARTQVEARLLARQTDAEVGTAVGVPPGVVHFYEQLFFHCRDVLHRPSFVRNQLLFEDPAAPTIATAVKRCGYFLGPVALAAVLAVVPEHGRRIDRPTPQTVEDWEVALDRAVARLWLAEQLVSPFDRHMSAIIRHMREIISLGFDSDVASPFKTLQLDPLVLPIYPKPLKGNDLRVAAAPVGGANDAVEARVSPKKKNHAEEFPDSGLSSRNQRSYGRERLPKAGKRSPVF